MKRLSPSQAILLVTLIVTLACILILTRIATRNAAQVRFWQDSYEGMVTNR